MTPLKFRNNYLIHPKTPDINLPLEDFPQRGVLDPLDAVNSTLEHGAPEQFLNHIVILRRFGERNELKDESKVRRSYKTNLCLTLLYKKFLKIKKE